MPYQPHPSGRPWPPRAAVAAWLALFAALTLGRIATRCGEPSPRAASQASVGAGSKIYDARPFAAFLQSEFGSPTDAPPSSISSISSTPPTVPATPFQRGVGLGLYSKDPDYDYGPMIGEIAAHGAGSIAVFIQLYQDGLASNIVEPAFDPATMDRVLARALDHARAAGLEPMVIPITLLRRAKRGEWRGKIRPADPEAWFASYGAAILRLANVAREHGAAGFCVGSELAALEPEAARWRDLIRRVRAMFPGRLTYSANWDRYDRVPFWAVLDAIGVSGYYELTNKDQPALDELVAAWARERNRLLAWRRRAGLAQPIVFTEIGYPKQIGAAAHPWDYTANRAPDPAGQARAHEAFMRAWTGQTGPEGLGGVYFYQWFGRDSPDDTGYSPRGKPAAELIRMWYESMKPRGADKRSR